VAADAKTHDVVFVGRLSAEKGVPLVLDLARARPQLRFALIGSGPLEDEVRGAAATLDNVDVLGLLSNREVLDVMASSRVVAVPAAWSEPFGRVAAEALSVGTPPVVSARGGLPEVVEGLHDSLVVPDDSLGSWIRAVDRITSLTSDDAARLADTCQTRWKERFALEPTIAQLESIYLATV
jgi:glycosyltransferase involved in cell wall biosynthesis